MFEFSAEYMYDEICTESSAAVVRDIAISQLTWYRSSTSPSEHEFLVAQVERPRVATVYLILEGTPIRDNNVIPPSGYYFGDLSALDTVKCLRLSDLTELIASRTANEIVAYYFPKFPILDFMRIVHMVSLYRETHKTDDTTSHWYASTIVGIARQSFGSCGRSPFGQVGQFLRLKTHTIDPIEEEAAEIGQKYIAARTAVPDPVGPMRERLRETWRSTEERERELTRAAEERVREAEERLRKLDEELRALRMQPGIDSA